MRWPVDLSRLKPAAVVAIAYAVFREFLLDVIFNKPSDWVWENTGAAGDFVEWRWSTLVVCLILFGGIYVIAKALDSSGSVGVSESESALKLKETSSVTILPSNGQSALQDFKNVTITPDDDGEFVWLRVGNGGPTGAFTLSVELEATGTPEHPYHPPWRNNNVAVLKIVKGDKGVVNIAQINPENPVLVTRELTDGVARGEVPIRFFSTENVREEFYKTFPVPSSVQCRITVFHVEHGPVAPTRNYVLEIEATDRMRFFERQEMEEGKQHTNEHRSEPEYIGEGIWHEVKWRGRRLSSGRIHADGPLCIDDDAALQFVGSLGRLEPVEDYHEVRPPRHYLVCPDCDNRYYLDATEHDYKRIGTARRNAAWRLGGGRTRLEEIFDRTGLL